MVHVPTMRCAASVRQAYCRGRTISRRGIARACCLLIDGYRLRNHKCRVAAQSLRPRHRNNRRSGEKGGGLEPAIAAPRPRQRAHAADDRAPGISSGQASNRAASLFGSSGWLPSVDGIAVMSRVPRGRVVRFGAMSLPARGGQLGTRTATGVCRGGRGGASSQPITSAR